MKILESGEQTEIAVPMKDRKGVYIALTALKYEFDDECGTFAMHECGTDDGYSEPMLVFTLFENDTSEISVAKGLMILLDSLNIFYVTDGEFPDC